MKPIIIPDAIDPLGYSQKSGVFYFDYRSSKISLKNKVKLNKFVFCFLNEGNKEIHVADSRLKLDKGEAFILPTTNCLMTEKTSPLNEYRSILFFVDPALIQQFVLKHRQTIINKNKQPTVTSKAFGFTQDRFIRLFLESLSVLNEMGLPKGLTHLKVEELLLYLLGKYTATFSQFLFDTDLSNNKVSFRKIIENCVDENHTIEQLAFLCNMSRSTFKRHFVSTFHKSPHQWFLDKKMEKAALLLKNNDGSRPSDIYVELGFESLSSFINAFKQKFGTTPKRYQSR